MDYSFYLLEIAIDPGGSRRNDVYIFNNLAEVKGALLADFAQLPELLLGSGQHLWLRTYVGEKEIGKVNLSPRVTVHASDGSVLSFDEDGHPLGGEELCNQLAQADVAHSSELVERFGLQFTVDWSNLCSLPEPILPAGQPVFLIDYNDLYLLPYGYSDQEFGEPDESLAVPAD